MQRHDVIIIGAGAAGLFCAATAGQRGRRVLLLDHAQQAGAKILISGGGRCNFTNTGTRPERFFSDNPHFCKSALKRFTAHDFIALVDRHKIAWHEKTLGQLFCDGSATSIVRMLLDECAAGQVDIRLRTRIQTVTRGTDFLVQTDGGAFSAPALVLATGGLSIPKMGASGFAYDLARQFGLPVVAPRPALVPLTAAPADLEWITPISGVSLDVMARFGKTAFREAMLFTHRGLSGPAILQISSCWQPGEPVVIDMLPDIADAAAFLRERKRARPNAELKTVLAEVLPQRLAHALLAARLAQQNAAIGTLPDKALNRIGALLKNFVFLPAGTEGFAKAEVTLGGVCTSALSSRSLQANTVPGLYVIGEAVDVTGWLGGYNFQWAWASGHSAGQAV